MRPLRTNRVDRLLRLILALQSGRPTTVDELAEIIGVSRRTIFRDLETLSEAGLPFEYDRTTHRYSTERLALLPPVNLTHAEALSILMATRHLLDHQLLVDRSAATSAGLKIESTLPRAVQDYCGPLLDQIDVRHSPSTDPQASRDVFTGFQIALSRHFKVRVCYRSVNDGELLDVCLHPYRLVYLHDAWYAVAFSQEADAVQVFKLRRIVEFHLLTEEYEVDADFTLDDYFGLAWRVSRGDRRHHVRVRFEPAVADHVEETRWHKTQRTTRRDDGALHFEADVDGLDEISWWIQGFGDQAEVLEPAELRRLVAERAQRTLALYQSSMQVV